MCFVCGLLNHVVCVVRVVYHCLVWLCVLVCNLDVLVCFVGGLLWDVVWFGFDVFLYLRVSLCVVKRVCVL